MPLSSDIADSLLAFHHSSEFGSRGGVVTDLDGTAVREREGRVYVAEPVAEGLRALVERGRPVVLNTLRFPLNVIRTFGREWSAITADPVPLVSLNGAVIGLLRPTDVGETTFDELAAFPLSVEQIDEVAKRLDGLLRDGVDDIVLFHYPRDWREGELVWTPHPERVSALREKYQSASVVRAGPLPELHDALLRDGACMLSLLVDLPADRLMAYQHSDPGGFLSAAGVDKLSGAREAAARLGFDLDQSVGAGDTPMDRFLVGCGLAIHVGPMELDFRGRIGTIRLRDPFELGEALFQLAGFPREASAA
jgi:hydroxymethylpyrimidine pyrophosphatase-like HAD family hydrolase